MELIVKEWRSPSRIVEILTLGFQGRTLLWISVVEWIVIPFGYVFSHCFSNTCDMAVHPQTVRITVVK